MVEAVVTIRHDKTPKATIKEIKLVTVVMDIISREATGIESGIINKNNNIGTHTIEILLGTTEIIIQWLNQLTVTTIEMMKGGLTVSLQLKEKEITMAAAIRPNESPTPMFPGDWSMLVKQLLTIRLLVAVVYPVTTTAQAGELMVGLSQRATIHATVLNSHHRNTITDLVSENQGAEVEVEHQSDVLVIQE